MHFLIQKIKIFSDMTNPPDSAEEIITLPVSITQNRESTRWSWLNPGNLIKFTILGGVHKLGIAIRGKRGWSIMLWLYISSTSGS